MRRKAHSEIDSDVTAAACVASAAFAAVPDVASTWGAGKTKVEAEAAEAQAAAPAAAFVSELKEFDPKLKFFPGATFT